MHSYFFKSFGLIQGAIVGFEDFTNWMHTNYLLDKLLDRLDKFFGVARRQKTFTAIRGLRERHELQMHLMAFMVTSRKAHGTVSQKRYYGSDFDCESTVLTRTRTSASCLCYFLSLFPLLLSDVPSTPGTRLSS